MEYFCIVKGKDLKKIAKSTYGILVMRYGTLVFYDPTLGAIVKVDACKPKDRKGFVLVSYNFDRLRRLSDEEIYGIDYSSNSGIIIENYRTGETVLDVPGILAHLP